MCAMNVFRFRRHWMEERIVVHFGCSDMHTECLMKMCDCRCEHERKFQHFWDSFIARENKLELCLILQMPCELPDNVCLCFNLKDGGKLIANLCFATSVISCIMLLVYFFSDFDSIASEIADNNKEMVEVLQQSRFCKNK